MMCQCATHSAAKWPIVPGRGADSASGSRDDHRFHHQPAKQTNFPGQLSSTLVGSFIYGLILALRIAPIEGILNINDYSIQLIHTNTSTTILTQLPPRVSSQSFSVLLTISANKTGLLKKKYFTTYIIRICLVQCIR